MATGYKINFTDDPLDARNFLLSPYTTNGPVAPNNDLPDSKATSAATTLLLYGKGMPDYGERIQENMVHLLENFSSSEEPVYPINGQLWFDRANSQLRVYDALRDNIVTNPGGLPAAPAGSVWISVQYTSNAKAVEESSRFVSGFRIRIFQESTGIQENRSITNSAVVTGDIVSFAISGTNPIGADWYVGGWEFVLQNNAPLRDNLDAAGYTIQNLPDPNPTSDDAAPASWVTQEIADAIGAFNDTIGNLDDVTITAPLADDILVYDGVSQWVNVAGNTVYLPLSGGTMTGPIDMGSQLIQQLQTPVSDYDAATKKYVDDEISGISGGVPVELDDLADVNAPSPSTNDILYYTGTQWRNQTPAASPFLLKSGGTLTGNLTLAGPGHTNSPGLAATENFVTAQLGATLSSANAYTDSQIALLPAEDYVTTGFYDSGAQELTLNRLLGGNVVIDFSGGTITSTGLTHDVGDVQAAPLVDFNGGLAFEELFYDQSGYPDLALDIILDRINMALGAMTVPKGRITFTSNGNSTIYLGDTSGGAQANQMNPTGDLTPENVYYNVGFHNMEIYVNGVKQYADPAGFQRVEADGSPGFRLHKGARTGLLSGSPLSGGPYDFRITVNGGTQVTISIPGVLTIGEMIDEINAVADTQYWQSGSPNANYAFGCDLNDGAIVFYSGLPGSGSSIALAAGTTTDLFAALVGDAGTTGAFTVSIGSGIDPNYAPTNLGYSEVGRFGEVSEVVVFNTPPASGAIVEVITEFKPIVR